MKDILAKITNSGTVDEGLVKEIVKDIQRILITSDVDVKLVKDISNKDKYDRLLRHVYVDEVLISEILVKQGFAKAVTYLPDVQQRSILKQAQKYAKENKLGLWADEPCKK